MKILFTQETDRIHGKVKQQQYLAEMLVHQGHEIRVIDNEIAKQRPGKRGIFFKLDLPILGETPLRYIQVGHDL